MSMFDPLQRKIKWSDLNATPFQSDGRVANLRGAADLELSAYLDRIGFTGTPAPDRATLETMQRLHLLAIPYENVDVQLGRPLTTDPAAAFEKLVTRRRGGWCYEMNGLFGWALSKIGFPVTRLASGVMRDTFGEATVGNHLVLRVACEDGPRLADVGLGNGPIAPFALMPGAFVAGGLEFFLEALGDGWWRLNNHAGALPPSFDFHLDRIDEPLLSASCLRLQTEPTSIFVQNLLCQRFVPEGHLQLLGRTLKRVTRSGTEERLISSAGELIDILARDFGIEEPQAADLWPRVAARHAELFD